MRRSPTPGRALPRGAARVLVARSPTALRAAAVALPAVLLVVGCGGASAEQERRDARALAAARERGDAEYRVLQLRERSARLRARVRRLEERTATRAQSQRTVPAAGSAGGGLLSSADAASLGRLGDELGARVRVAVGLLGGDAAPDVAGSLRSGAAWSSIKVPLSVAALEAGSASESDVAAAITESDNAAADRLWDGLGGGSAAAAAVGRALAAGGDTETTVQAEQVRPPYSPYGQTRWSLSRQVRYLRGLGCSAAGRTVLTRMGEVSGDQRWGLGTLGSSTRFKGGWGPGPSGGYLVRQLGVFRVEGTDVAAAVAVEPGDGAFATGTSDLSRVAAWTKEHVDAGAGAAAGAGDAC